MDVHAREIKEWVEAGRPITVEVMPSLSSGLATGYLIDVVEVEVEEIRTGSSAEGVTIYRLLDAEGNSTTNLHGMYRYVCQDERAGLHPNRDTPICRECGLDIPDDGTEWCARCAGVSA